MPTMRASVLRGVHDLAVEERPVPRPAPDEVLVRVASVGVCGSDIHYYEAGRIGPYVVDKPLVLGHEASGEVVELGADVAAANGRLHVGQRVSLEPGVPCRNCSECLAGRYNLCPRVEFFATPPYDGAFCEFVTLPAPFVHPVPDSMSEDSAALLEPLSVAVWGCRRGQVGAGSRVLVTGAGAVGLLCAQTARACGATEVLVTDVNATRLAMAEKVGASTVNVADQTLAEAGFSPDVLLECSGNAAATREAIRTVARAGHVVLIGMGGDELPIPLPYLQDHELWITGAFRYANTWPTAIALAASGAVTLEPLVTGHYGLDQVEEALTAPARDPDTVKPVVRPGS